MSAPTLTYRGDATAALLANGGQVMGPNTMDEYLQVVDAVFDPELRRTVASFRFVPPAELERLVREPGSGLLYLAPAEQVAS